MDPYVTDIGDTTQFFIDDAMVAAKQGLQRRFVQAEKNQGPVIRRTEEYEGTYLTPVAVIPNDGAAAYRMWYMSLKSGANGIIEGHKSFLHTAVSDDGVHWDKQPLNLCTINGSTANNINVFDDGTPCSVGRAVFRDDAEPDPAKLYKLMYYLPNYYLAYSPDGTRWTRAQEDPVWPNGAGAGLEETSFFLRDELTQRYRGYMRVWQRHQTIRKLSLGESDNLLEWTGPEIIWEAGPEFGPGAQIYGMNVFVEGGVYWGVPWMCYTDEPLDPEQHQTMHFKLAWSQDGIDWAAVCPEQDLVELGGEGEFDRYMMISMCPVVPTADRLRLYYFGADARHGTGGYNAAIGLAEMRRGGFVCLRAEDEGVLLTRRFLLRGDGIRINAKALAGGSVAAELLNDGGAIMKQFSFADFDVLEGDKTDHLLSWQGVSDLSALTGQNLMLRLRLRQAELFSFRVSGDKEKFTTPLGPTPVRCGQCLRPPVIDGALDDQCWQDFSRTGIADDFVRFAEQTPATVRTRVSMTYDQERLYIGVDCEEPLTENLVAACTDEEDGYTFKKDDAIEVRLNAPGQGTFFNQLCVNSAGNRFHAWFSVEEGGSHVVEELGWEARTTVVAGHWYVEMSIPFAALRTSTPSAGDRWNMNIFRFRQAGDADNSSWSCTFGSVHRNDLSGVLSFA